MAEHRGRLQMLVGMAQDFTELLILHQVDDRRLAAGDEEPIIAVQSLVEDRTKRAPLHRGVGGVEDLRALINLHVATEMRRRETRNPFSSLWGDEESEAPRASPNQFGNLPFATYRTLCVRLCDGYYFPVSFSTLPNHFQRDSDLCQSQCAAPADLYYHQNPGGAVEQMVSVNSQQPYTSLKSAWRYRKEYVQGCSCKQAEYDQKALEKRAEAPPAAAPAAQPPSAGVRVGAKK